MANASGYVLDFERPLVELEKKLAALRALSASGAVEVSSELASLEKKAKKLAVEIFGSLTRWQVVQLSRHPSRPFFLDYVQHLFTDFVELCGDRHFADDRSIVGGFARFDGRPVLVLGHQKGRNTKESMERNFGMPRPEGYRKARRLMELAERFGKPILTFVDTMGAYPGMDAEERGQAEAIAVNLEVMSRLRVPIISTVIGEGGSGGALAIGVGNRVLMLENSIYSVITPEGCASILFRDAAQAPRAADALKLTAKDLSALKVLDEVVPEPLGGAHRDPAKTAEALGKALRKHLTQLADLSPEALVKDRYEKFRAFGVFSGR
ncbi:acetyl-CoA carboxylase carboxyltransferase subunit alpha [Pyxidicoccus xibeiensis]|uniref:acetyl-CoA carboxylase carboxyltransferase subunit alpha n=1 Tax=Pyxidicoccus xibeiensis TaxID=2906759 RepID=UPI0020A77EB3|nr:acetyl-CoA carboxylase carboxyltransferase subunit alpha [Pyxidicoccus xibeiensis]MCP3140372.1 acetyl-CoA carboxylase carboxyltransferase subunit alpha [Pyxidicoccus xibeiensis]